MRNILNFQKKYSVALVILNVAGLMLIAGSLSVKAAPPLITWNPDPVEDGDEVTFSAIEPYSEYRWWISDGPGNTCTLTDTPETDATFTRTMIESGDWEVCLEVPDGEGGFVTDRQTVTVNNFPPAIAVPSYWIATPEPSLMYAPFHVEVPFTDYEDLTDYSCTINYDDGSGELTGSIQYVSDFDWLCVGPDHTYTNAGLFDVRATIADDPESSSMSDPYSHTVAHLFDWTPTEPLEGGSATFTAVSGYYSHYWTKSFNPGEPCNSPASYYYVSPLDISFWSSGQYQVCISMYDSSTNQNVTDSQWLTVTNVAPNNVDIHTNPQPAFPGMQVSLDVHFNDYDDGPYTISVNWRDSSTPETIVTNKTYISGQQHTYTEVGDYTVQVSVTDKDGATGTGSINQYVTTLMVEPEASWMASNTLPTTIELQGAGIDAGHLSFSIASQPGYGTLGTLSPAICQPITMPNFPSADLVLCKASVVFTPGDTPADGTSDLFTFTMSDGINTSPEGSINLWIGPNGAPSALPTEALVSQVSPSYIFLTATDPDIHEYYNDRITFSIDDHPVTGTLGLPGKPHCDESWNSSTEEYERICTSAVLYTPNAGISALTDSFSFHVNDSHQDSNTANVLLNLHPPVTLHVNTTNTYDDGNCDEDSCGLREAIDAAMVGDIIDFTLSIPATIYLGGDQHIRIDKSISITGPGAQLLTISGALSSRVFEFSNGGVPMIASISGMTIKDARADSGGGLLIEEAAEVTVTDCVIGPNNVVTYAGGGIANFGGTLTLNRSTVVENHGTGTLGGAGIVTTSSGATTTLINSTVTGNVTNNYGGGILAAYGGRVDLIHSTVTGNTANANYDTEPWGGGGGIHIMDNGLVSIKNSIVAGNIDWTGSVEPGDENYHVAWNDVSGVFYSLGGNLIGDVTGSSGWSSGDLFGNSTTPLDPMLGLLDVHSPGTTPTFPLEVNSPAIDAVTCAAGVAADQRGLKRPQGIACDIGSFEVENPWEYLFLPLVLR